MDDSLQNTLHDTHLFTLSPLSPLGHRCLARCIHSPRKTPCRRCVRRTWGNWWGMLLRHPLAFLLMPHLYATAPVCAGHTCHASGPARVTERARCTTRRAACSLSASVPSPAPFPCISPFVNPLYPSFALSALSHTRTVHRILMGTCSLRHSPACPRSRPVFWLCPISSSLPLCAHDAQQCAWHPRSLSSLFLAALLVSL